MLRCLITLFLLCSLEIRAVALPAFEGRIKIKASARIAGERVRLSDIARLDGSAKQFAAIELSSKLSPGETRRLDGYTILNQLARAGVDLKRVAYEIPVSVAITRSFQEVSAEQVREAVEDYLRNEGAPLAKAELKGIEYQSPVWLPTGPYEIEVRGDSGSLRQGRLRVRLQFLRDGNIFKELPAAVALGVYGQGYFVRRTVQRGEIISASDLVVKKRDISKLPVDAVARAEQAIGMKAARMLRPDLPLTLSDLVMPTLVKRGSLVTLVVETEGIKVTTQGVAREDGILGKQIRVMNRESGKELFGRVAGGSVVLVEF